MNPIVGIDPGPTKCGLVVWDGKCVQGAGEPSVEWLLKWLRETSAERFACETVQHMGTGMPAGREVFETAFLIGRIMEILGPRVVFVKRTDVKLFFCGSARAKDPNVRQALLDRYGPVQTRESYTPIGKKGQPLAPRERSIPGPLRYVSGHAWSALAIAIYAHEKELI